MNTLYEIKISLLDRDHEQGQKECRESQLKQLQWLNKYRPKHVYHNIRIVERKAALSCNRLDIVVTSDVIVVITVIVILG